MRRRARSWIANLRRGPARTLCNNSLIVNAICALLESETLQGNEPNRNLDLCNGLRSAYFKVSLVPAPRCRKQVLGCIKYVQKFGLPSDVHREEAFVPWEARRLVPMPDNLGAVGCSAPHMADGRLVSFLPAWPVHARTEWCCKPCGVFEP